MVRWDEAAGIDVVVVCSNLQVSGVGIPCAFWLVRRTGAIVAGTQRTKSSLGKGVPGVRQNREAAWAADNSPHG